MKALYDRITSFMEAYFPAYSQKGQIAETIHLMDEFYAPDLRFDDGVMTSREQWYARCLSHPSLLDRLSVEHLFIDEKQLEVGALVKTQLVEITSGQVLVEIKMNVLYCLSQDENQKLKISAVKVYLESDPGKAAQFFNTLSKSVISGK